MVRDMYLFEVKKPAESKGAWDFYKLVGTIPGEQAYKRPNGNECPAGEGVADAAVIARSAATKQSRWGVCAPGTRMLRFARNDGVGKNGADISRRVADLRTRMKRSKR